MLNLEWFRTFKAIYEEGNLSNAAQILFISQPCVSLHLSSLEAFTGYCLFDRSKRKVVPTERGTILYNYILDSMNQLGHAEKVFRKTSKTDKPTIGIGMCFEIFQEVLEPNVANLPFNLVTHFGDYSQMSKELSNGVLDLTLTPDRGDQINIEYRPLFEQKIQLICGRNTDVAPLESLLLSGNKKDMREWLAHQIWYTNSVDMKLIKQFWQTNFDCLPSFNPNFVLPYFGSILRCLDTGSGFALVPDFLCRHEQGNQHVKVVWEGFLPIENTLYLGRRKQTLHSDQIRKLEQILLEGWLAIQG